MRMTFRLDLPLTNFVAFMSVIYNLSEFVTPTPPQTVAPVSVLAIASRRVPACRSVLEFLHITRRFDLFACRI